MSTSLRALLSGILDYAGLFPPAKLPLDEAIRNYARYRQEPENWMLGRFILPAARLAELDAFADLFLQGPPFVFSVLGRSGSSPDDFLAGVGADLEAVSAFRERHGSSVVVDVYESKLPEQVNYWLSADKVRNLILACSMVLDPQRTADLMPYFECGFGPDWRESLPLTLNGIAGFTQDFGRPAGFKLRCGGLDAAAFPSPERVAFVLGACRDAGVPLKFTAGLHHPIRRFDASVGTKMHGFLNVLDAGVLAHARRLTEEQLILLLEEGDPKQFFFEEEFRWRDWCASTEEIRTVRRSGLISFGSCSFDEPRDDLRALGWL
jgi:hypothetical protein